MGFQSIGLNVPEPKPDGLYGVDSGMSWDLP